MKTKEQIEISAKDRTGAALKQAEKGFQSLDNKMAGALKGAAALAGTVGLLAVVKNSLSAANAIVQYSKAIGVSTQELSAWGIAAKTVNLEQEKLNDILKDTADKIGDAYANKAGAAVEVLAKLNLQAADLARLSPDQQLLRIAEQLDNVGTQSEKVFILEALAGDASLLLPLLDDNAKAFKEIRREAIATGAAFTELDNEAITRANQKIILLEEVMSKKLIKTVADNAEAIGNLAESMIELGGAVASAFGTVSSFSEGLGSDIAKLRSESVLFDLALKRATGGLIDFVGESTVAVTAVDLVEKKIEATRYAMELANSTISNDGFLGFGGSTAAEIATAQAQLNQLEITLQKQLQVRQQLMQSAGQSPVQGVPSAGDTGGGGGAPVANDNLFAQPTSDEVVMFGATDDQEQARIDRRNERITLQLATEEESASMAFIRREEMIELAFQEGLIEEERRKQLMLDLEENYNDEITRIQSDSLSAQEMMWDASFKGKLNVVQGVLGQMSNLMQSESKKQFEIGKKAAIAQAVINTYQMATSSYNALSGIPYVGPFLGAVAAAAAIVYGKNQISKIKSQQFGGGSVGGAGGSPGGSAGSHSANPNTGAPTGSPAGGPTNINDLNGQQQEPTRVVNISYQSTSQQDAENARELIELIDEQTGDGVELNIDIG